MQTFRRARPHLAVYAAVGVVAALVTATLIGLLGALEFAADQGVRLGLATRSGADLALRTTLPLSEDREAQDASVRRALATTLDGLSAAPDITAVTTLEAPVQNSRTTDQWDALVLVDAGLARDATLISGRWPSGPDEATVQADAAAERGIETGDRLAVRGSAVTVVGTWRVTDPLAGRWLGDDRILGGGTPSGGTIALATLPSIVPDAPPRSHWTVAFDPAAVTAADLDRVLRQWPGLRSSLRASSVDTTSFATSGRFEGTATALRAQVDGMRAVTPAIILLIAVSALVAIAELARLASAARAQERSLLWSRGRSAVAAGSAAALGGAVAAATGAVAGAALGAVLGAWLGAGVWPGSPLLIPAIVLLLALVAGACFGAGGIGASRPQRDLDVAGTRAARLVAPGAAILTGLAATLAVWQLRLYGSPVTGLADGGEGIDPLAVLAPALALVAVVFVVLALLPVLARTQERLARDAGAPRLVAMHSLTRRLPRLAAAVVVVAVAGGTATAAAAYQATWSAAFERASALRAGADVLATPARAGFANDSIAAVGELPGVESAFPVQLATVRLRDLSAELVAAPPSALPHLTAEVRRAVDAPGLAKMLRVEPPGPRIPAEAEYIELIVDTEGIAVDPSLTLLVLDAGGTLTRIVASTAGSGDVAAMRRLAASFELPSAARDGDARIIALDVDLDESAIDGPGARFVPREWTAVGASAVTDQIGESEPGASGTPALGTTSWSPRTDVWPVAPEPLTGGGFGASPGVTGVRLLPDVERPAGMVKPPLAVSRDLAARYDLEIGDPFSFGVERASSRVAGVVAAILPAIPSAASTTAVLMDMTVLQVDAVLTADLPPAPNALWIAAADGRAPVDEIRRVLPASTTILTAADAAGRAIQGATTTAMWTAAGLCGVLALVTLLAVASSEHRARAHEVGLLRALGFRSREQGAIRRGEWVLVVLCGALTGLLGGLLVAVLTVPELAGAAVPTTLGLEVPLRFGLPAILLAYCLLLATAGGVIAWVAWRTARSARSTRGLADRR